jgi:hypothetical protein
MKLFLTLISFISVNAFAGSDLKSLLDHKGNLTVTITDNSNSDSENAATKIWSAITGDASTKQVKLPWFSMICSKGQNNVSSACHITVKKSHLLDLKRSGLYVGMIIDAEVLSQISDVSVLLEGEKFSLNVSHAQKVMGIRIDKSLIQTK